MEKSGKTGKLTVLTLAGIIALTLIQRSFWGAPPTLTFSSRQDSVQTDSSRADSSGRETLPRKLDRTIANNAFDVGERLSFVVRYGFIKAGNARMEVKELVPVENRMAYRIISSARSKRTFDFFFKVRDRVESWVDRQGIFSWKFTKKLREGSYKFDLLVDYDQWMGKAHIKMIRYHSVNPVRIKNRNEFEIPIPPYVLDILAAFYYVRTRDLQVGMPIFMSTHDNKKVYDLKVLIQRKEIVKVKAGKFHCIKVQPQLRGEAIFKQKGKLWVWLTDDQYKIPVQMKSAVFIGSITTELTKIEGVPLPLPSQIP